MSLNLGCVGKAQDTIALCRESMRALLFDNTGPRWIHAHQQGACCGRLGSGLSASVDKLCSLGKTPLGSRNKLCGLQGKLCSLGKKPFGQTSLKNKLCGLEKNHPLGADYRINIMEDFSHVRASLKYNF